MTEDRLPLAELLAKSRGRRFPEDDRRDRHAAPDGSRCGGDDRRWADAPEVRSTIETMDDALTTLGR